mgnify:CR=1 FL=1
MQQATLSAFVCTKDPQPPSPPQTTDHAKAVCWSLCYVRRLVRSHIPDDPLLRTLYAGQAVRPDGKRYPTAQALAEVRWKEEDAGSKHGDGSNLTFLEVLRVYGPEAFDNEVVWSTKGPRWEVQPLANAKEVALIAKHGGPVRNLAPDAPIKQTFNRQKGGKNLKNWYDSLHGAFSTKRWKLFQSELLKHIAEFGTAYVESVFVAKNMYRLGNIVVTVRGGIFIDGHPERHAWLNAQPGWTWKATQSAEYLAKSSKQSLDWWESVTDAEKAEITRKRMETRNAKTDAEKAETKRKLKETIDAKTDAEKAETKRKRKATKATDASKAKRSKITTDRHTTERRAELERARLIVVPFEKSRKRRVEMRAASTDFSGLKGNAVLYMVSEDGLTIRRVQPDGTMRKCKIVGPVVDPAPSDAFDTDSD